MIRPNLEEHIRESLELGPEYVVHQLAQEIIRLRNRESELENLLILQDKDALGWQERVSELEAQLVPGPRLVPDFTGEGSAYMGEPFPMMKKEGDR